MRKGLHCSSTGGELAVTCGELGLGQALLTRMLSQCVLCVAVLDTELAPSTATCPSQCWYWAHVAVGVLPLDEELKDNEEGVAQQQRYHRPLHRLLVQEVDEPHLRGVQHSRG